MKHYSPNHPSVLSSPHVMTDRQWNRIYRWPLVICGVGTVAIIAGLFMPILLVYGQGFSMLWSVPGMVIVGIGLAKLGKIYDLECEFDQ